MNLETCSEKISGPAGAGKRCTAAHPVGGQGVGKTHHFVRAEWVKIIGVREGQENSSALENPGGL